MEWYEKLDYEENPFKQDDDIEIIGYDNIVDEVLYRITAGSIVCVEAKEGYGKTALLKAAINQFKGTGRVAYVNCQKLDQKINIESIIKKKNGLLGNLMNKKPKGMILLLDNIESISERNSERLKYFFDNNYIKSVVLTTPSYKGLPFTDSLRERVSKILSLRQLTEDEAVDMLYSRIRDHEGMISEDMIKELFLKSDKNQKIFLKNSEEIFKYAIDNNYEKILEDHLEKILGSPKKPKKNDSKKEKVEIIEPEKDEKPKVEIIEEKDEQKPSPQTKKDEPKIEIVDDIPEEKSIKEEKKGEEPVKIKIVEDDFKPIKNEVKMEEEYEEMDIDQELSKLSKKRKLTDEALFDEESSDAKVDDELKEFENDDYEDDFSDLTKDEDEDESEDQYRYY